MINIPLKCYGFLTIFMIQCRFFNKYFDPPPDGFFGVEERDFQEVKSRHDESLS